MPGPYYLLGIKVPLVGSAARDTMRAGHTPDLDTLAVNFGVKAIQQLLNYTGAGLVRDGVFGRGTEAAVGTFQSVKGLKVDRSVGMNTMRALLLPHIKRHGDKYWAVVYGLLKNEGAFDPGAVGVIDPQDLGLAQINGRAHPDMTIEQRFDPIVAIQFNATYLANALDKLGDMGDAVLSYNLGIGGVRYLDRRRPAALRTPRTAARSATPWPTSTACSTPTRSCDG